MDNNQPNISWEEKNLIKPKKNYLNSNVSEQPDTINDIKIDSMKSPCKTIGRKRYYEGYDKQYKEFDKKHEIHIARKYKITLKQYDDILKSQNKSCAICGISVTMLKRNICVDHCHKTGKVRGLLCGNCNSTIGYAKDNIDVLNNAIKYLKKHGHTMSLGCAMKNIDDRKKL